MKKLPRRLLMWGGAAAIATAGFAYMASNSVAASSAGEGVGPVTGYQVSNTTYDTTCTGYIPGQVCNIADFSFYLAPDVNTSQAPKIVTVILWAGPVKLATLGNPAAGLSPTDTTCTIGSWTPDPSWYTSPTGYSYPVSCLVPSSVHVTEQFLTGLDVAASQ
jgi:hypothetical protein